MQAIMTAPVTAPEHDTNEPATAPACLCGAVLYDGACFNLGSCDIADNRSARNAGRDTAKGRAWTISGGVD